MTRECRVQPDAGKDAVDKFGEGFRITSTGVGTDTHIFWATGFVQGLIECIGSRAHPRPTKQRYGMDYGATGLVTKRMTGRGTGTRDVVADFQNVTIRDISLWNDDFKTWIVIHILTKKTSCFYRKR